MKESKEENTTSKMGAENQSSGNSGTAISIALKPHSLLSVFLSELLHLLLSVGFPITFNLLVAFTCCVTKSGSASI